MVGFLPASVYDLLMERAQTSIITKQSGDAAYCLDTGMFAPNLDERDVRAAVVGALGEVC